MSIWTCVAVKFFIVLKLNFLAKILLRHRTFIGKYRCEFILKFELKIKGKLQVSCSLHVRFIATFKQVINRLEGTAIMKISCMTHKTKHLTMLITDDLWTIGKDFFVLVFVKPATFRICRTYFL
ncbi:hypothetical protein KF146HA_02095 [Lactococcus lactis]|nr:hypothetical protein CV702_05835 [Lactococcus lactis subsp. lactis]ATZ01258.1 hypothetical protein CV098_05420 [Lactococcus lactis subsp. lactis]MDU0398598.1 hypothetical protein [Lactococcus lactis]